MGLVRDMLETKQKEIEENKEKSRKELEDLSGEERIFMESIINDKTDIIPEDQYIPINIPNTELLGDTVETNLTDILINDKKEYNIFANIVICYIKKGKIDEEENETEEEEKKEMIEKRKKELEKLDKDKNISITYKPNGKKVYYKLTKYLFFNFRKINIKSTDQGMGKYTN